MFKLADLYVATSANQTKNKGGLAQAMSKLSAEKTPMGFSLTEIAKQVKPNGLQPKGMSVVLGALTALVLRDERSKRFREAFAEMNHALRQAHEFMESKCRETGSRASRYMLDSILTTDLKAETS